MPNLPLGRAIGRPTRRHSALLRFLTVPVLALVAFATVGGAVSCTSTSEQPAAPERSTTTGPPLTTPDMATAAAPPEAAELVARIEAAGASDLCGLIGAMDSVQPDGSDRSGTIEVYEALLAAMTTAEPSVPPELDAAWSDLVDGTTDGLAALRAAGGDVGDPEFKVAFRRTATVEAIELLERYQARNCG